MTSSFLITPINVAGELKCCIQGLKRTEAVLIGDAIPAPNNFNPFGTNVNVWRIFLASESNPQSGELAFGVCCAKEVTIELKGTVRNDHTQIGDFIEVFENGLKIYEADSSDFLDIQMQSPIIAANPSPIIRFIENRPCGNVFEIKGDSGPSFPVGTEWYVKITVE